MFDWTRYEKCCYTFMMDIQYISLSTVNKCILDDAILIIIADFLFYEPVEVENHVEWLS